MSEIFAPQLALFVAGRAELALYREFIFRSVPARTGLLPAGIDEIRASRAEMAPMAIDIALRKAAVVVYDIGRSSRLPLDYVQSLRDGRPVITVESINRSASQPVPGRGAPGPDPEPRMSTWVETFLEPVVAQIDALALRPAPAAVAERLTTLTGGQQYADLLLTSLAVLEHELRRDDAPTVVPTAPSEGTMARLRQYFGPDYQTVIDAVSLRHDVLEHPREDTVAPDDDLARVATALAAVVRRRLGLP